MALRSRVVLVLGTMTLAGSLITAPAPAAPSRAPSPDPSYGNGGVATLPGRPSQVHTLLDSAGRLWALDRGTLNDVLRRLDVDGRPDRTFGADGPGRTVLLGPPGGSLVAPLLVSPGDRVVRVYSQRGFDEASSTFTDERQLVIERFDDSGRPDPEFGEDGRVVLADRSPRPSSARAVEVDATGAVTVLRDPEGRAAGAQVVIERVGPDGELDRTFGDDGLARVPLRRGRFAFDPEIDLWWQDLPGQATRTARDGSVLVLQAVQGALQIDRLRPDGSRDPAFGDDGSVLLRGIARSWVGGALLTPGGDLLVPISSDAPTRSCETGAVDVIALASDGRVRTGFDRRSAPVPCLSGKGRYLARAELVPTPGGALLHVDWARRSSPSGDPDGAPAPSQVVGLLLDGARDPRFARGRILTTATDQELVAISLEQDRYVTVGKDRSTASSDSDQSPAPARFRRYDLPFTVTPTRTAPRTSAPTVAARAEPGPDPTYGTDGIGRLPAPANRESVSSDRRGGVLGIADLEDVTALRRLTPEGVLDTTFGGDGRVELVPPPGWARVLQPPVVGPDGSLLTLSFRDQRRDGRRVRAVRVERLTPDGLPLPGFGRRGTAVVELPRIAAGAIEVAIGPDGSVVVALQGSRIDPGPEDLVLTRLTPAGAVDRDFGRDGLLTLPAPQLAFTPHRETSVRALSDGGVLVVQAAGSLLRVQRLLADGRPDRRFADGGTFERRDLGLAYADGVLVTGTGASERIHIPVARGRRTRYCLRTAVDVVALNAAGVPDTAFGARSTPVRCRPTRTNNLLWTPDPHLLSTEGGGLLLDLDVVLDDPQLFVHGAPSRNYAVAYLPDGSPDPGFGRSGVLTTPQDHELVSVDRETGAVLTFFRGYFGPEQVQVRRYALSDFG